MKKYILGVMIVFVQLNALAQKKDKVLFTIDETPTYVSEFKKLFKPTKTSNPEQELQANLDLMVAYKLKLRQIKLEGIDTIPSVVQELNSYKKGLAAPFLTDDATLQELLTEAYDRKKYLIKASHVLIVNNGNDTVKAYNKTKEIQQKIKDGVDFNDLAFQYSEDRSAKQNKGSLGYFGVFKMVYPFEDAAYKTPVGQVSDVVKTKYGYHLIKVEDKIKSQGKVTVAHIMVAGLEESKKARIDSVYQKLQAGANFINMAQQYSDDKRTANAGGKLIPFEMGMLPKPFEKVAFSMSVPNAYSKPFTTRYGWHIVKFIEKQPVGSFEEEKEALKKKILKSKRSEKIKEAAFAKIEANHKVVLNKKAMEVFTVGKALAMPTDSLQDVLFTIDDKPYLQSGFAEYIKGKTNKSPLVFYKTYKQQKLAAYVIDHLEDENDEFNATITLYKNGLEIFELMKKHVWDVPAKKPELLEAYYKKHIDNYKDKGDSLEAVKGYVESDFQDEIQKKWLDDLIKASQIKFKKRQVKKLQKYYR